VTPFVEPDPSPDAGAAAAPLPDYIFTRDGWTPESDQPASELPRLQGIATWTFVGSDPATGLLDIELQRAAADGAWVTVTTPAGNPVNDALPDLIVTYTPEPLAGTGADPDPLRTHRYHVEWQALNSWAGLGEVPGLPLGTYRLLARGNSRDPADSDYPFDTLAWLSSSEPFEVVPAVLELSGELQGQELTISAAYAPVARGWRNLHLSSDPRTATPLLPGPDGVSVSSGEVQSLVDEGDTTRLEVDVASLESGLHLLTVDDGWGNVGTLEVEIP